MYPCRPVVECLEDRRVLSATPIPIVVVPGLNGLQGGAQSGTSAAPTKPTTSTHGTSSGQQTTSSSGQGTTQAATPPPTTGTRVTSLIGHFEGDVKTKVFIISLKSSAKLDITAQTDTTLTGTIEIKGKKFSGTFKGHINAKTGKFSYTVKDHGTSIKLTGTLSRSGTKMSGKIKAKYSGFSINGKYSFDKKAD